MILDSTLNQKQDWQDFKQNHSLQLKKKWRSDRTFITDKPRKLFLLAHHMLPVFKQFNSPGLTDLYDNNIFINHYFILVSKTNTNYCEFLIYNYVNLVILCMFT
ncbi:hypothetical protein BsWGS_25305 [Bradybaena similaris]